MNNTVTAIVLLIVLAFVSAAGYILVRLFRLKKGFYALPSIIAACFVALFVFSLMSVDTLVSAELYGEPVRVYSTDMLSGGYRYGAAIVTNENGKTEAFFSADYAASAWDAISYRTSNDNGENWGEEKITLVPVPNSDEHYSNCDPGVFRVGGWYYVGYTSTFEGKGRYNYIYCARSKTPADSLSWEKWNGSGWGGKDPKPIIRYFGTQTEYGIGEPSFVLLDDTVYVYYTYIGTLGNGATVRQTRVATAPFGENWCADLTDAGVARNGRGLAEDSWDVKYIPELKKFFAVCSDNRFSEKAYVKAFLSDDGVRFYEIPFDSSAAAWGMHNIGISGDGYGHMALNGAHFMVYAHATDGTWGKWNTSLSRIKLHTERVINFRKFFPDCAKNPKGQENNGAWGLTNVASQDADIPAGTYAATNVLKDDASYYWSENYSESRYAVALAVKSEHKRVCGVRLRFNEMLEGVPVDFRFEISNDGIVWQKAPCGEIKDFGATEYKTYDFPFDYAVKTKCVRLAATKLGKLGITELYALQVERFTTY